MLGHIFFWSFMELHQLLFLCKLYDSLGWAVQDQLHSVIEGEDLEDQNPNALELIEDFLQKVINLCNKWDGGDGLLDDLVGDCKEELETIQTFLEEVEGEQSNS